MNYKMRLIMLREWVSEKYNLETDLGRSSFFKIKFPLIII